VDPPAAGSVGLGLEIDLLADHSRFLHDVATHRSMLAQLADEQLFAVYQMLIVHGHQWAVKQSANADSNRTFGYSVQVCLVASLALRFPKVVPWHVEEDYP